MVRAPKYYGIPPIVILMSCSLKFARYDRAHNHQFSVVVKLVLVADMCITQYISFHCFDISNVNYAEKVPVIKQPTELKKKQSELN